MSESFFSSITRAAFNHGTLCECGHRRLDHRLLDSWADEEMEERQTKYLLEHPVVLCFCKCTKFKFMDNLRYLEIKVKEKSENINS